ncbi:TPA: oxidoreductase, partial [Campylobacter coli]|nr:oxidoreductase [Campylobacter coli]
MNLSSVLIVAKVQHIDELKKEILKIPSCSI